MEVQLFLLQFEQSGEEQLRVLVVFPSNKISFFSDSEEPTDTAADTFRTTEELMVLCLSLY